MHLGDSITVLTLFKDVGVELKTMVERLRLSKHRQTLETIEAILLSFQEFKSDGTSHRITVKQMLSEGEHSLLGTALLSFQSKSRNMRTS